MRYCDINDGDWLLVSDLLPSNSQNDDQLNLCIAFSHESIKNPLNVAFTNYHNNTDSNTVQIIKVNNPIQLNSLILECEESVEDSIEFFDLMRIVKQNISMISIQIITNIESYKFQNYF